MSPVTHFLVRWLVANNADLDRKGRAAVTRAAVAPDVDGIGASTEKLTWGWHLPLRWRWSRLWQTGPLLEPLAIASNPPGLRLR